MAITAMDIAWAAGFLEGEGCFSMSKQFQINIAATQVQKEPLDRLTRLFGGALNYHPMPRIKPGSHVRHRQPIWKWTLTGARATGLMFAMYGLMSPRRREKIRAVLAIWRTRPVIAKYRTHCVNGHEFSVHGATKPGYTTERARHRRCLTCHREKTRRYRMEAKTRAAAS